MLLIWSWTVADVFFFCTCETLEAGTILLSPDINKFSRDMIFTPNNHSVCSKVSIGAMGRSFCRPSLKMFSHTFGLLQKIRCTRDLRFSRIILQKENIYIQDLQAAEK